MTKNRQHVDLQGIGEGLDKVIQQSAGEATNFVLVFRLGDGTHCVSNLDHKDAINMVEEMLAQWKCGSELSDSSRH